MKPEKTYNPYCLVNICYYEATGKVLFCRDCIFEDCECKRVRVEK